MSDWIDDEHRRRAGGRIRPLLPSQHDAVNARYPGCTDEHCCACGQATGNAGIGDGSLYADDGEGPYCWECYPAKEKDEMPGETP